MNKHARARSIGKEELRIYNVQFMDSDEWDGWSAVRDQIHGGVLMLDDAAPNGERLNIPIHNIRQWWSEPAEGHDDDAREA